MPLSALGRQVPGAVACFTLLCTYLSIFHIAVKGRHTRTRHTHTHAPPLQQSVHAAPVRPRRDSLSGKSVTFATDGGGDLVVREMPLANTLLASAVSGYICFPCVPSMVITAAAT